MTFVVVSFRMDGIFISFDLTRMIRTGRMSDAERETLISAQASFSSAISKALSSLSLSLYLSLAISVFRLCPHPPLSHAIILDNNSKVYNFLSLCACKSHQTNILASFIPFKNLHFSLTDYFIYSINWFNSMCLWLK